MTDNQEANSEATDLQSAFNDILSGAYKALGARLHALPQVITCECNGVTVRAYYPAFRQGKPTVFELVDVICLYLTKFCLPRTRIKQVTSLYGQIPEEEYDQKRQQLFEEAKGLFIKANKATNRNGEAGELLLYLLTEWVLGAPQLVAKMSLKTNSEMPVFGADGIHVRYCAETSKIILYWGESKLYADVGHAIDAAVDSISNALKPDKMEHELDLIQSNIDLSGLDQKSKAEVLKYLDPMEDNYNHRHDVSTCLIGFNFDAYAAMSGKDGAQLVSEFGDLTRNKLTSLMPSLAAAMNTAQIQDAQVELFFLPVPSVDELRAFFQDKIGWKQ
jgi:hypothetical protein